MTVLRILLIALLAAMLAVGCSSFAPPDRDASEADTPESFGSFPMLGEVIETGFDFCPDGWRRADGAVLPIDGNQALFAVIGAAYGGDGRTTFGIPDMRGRMPIGIDLPATPPGRHGTPTVELDAGHLPSHSHGVMATGNPPAQPSPSGGMFGTFSNGSFYRATGTDRINMAGNLVSPTGAGAPIPITHSHLALTSCIAMRGAFPPRPDQNPGQMFDRISGELMWTAGSYCPAGFIPADGRPISLSGASGAELLLYSYIGEIYGGGPFYYNLPDLRNRSPIGQNPSAFGGRPRSVLGNQLGSATIRLTEPAPHSHSLRASAGPPDSNSPADHAVATFPIGSVFAAGTEDNLVRMSNFMVQPAGQSPAAAFNNIAPSTGLRACLVMDGMFPPRP